jgi:uncharacterized protein (DUF362 family)
MIPEEGNRVGLAVDPGLPDDAATVYRCRERLAGLIRAAMIQAGLGSKNPEAPLLDLIGPNMTVLLKPNWVFHENEGGYGAECLLTHREFILSTLQEVAKAGPRKIIIGDAPIQGCRWDRIVTDDFAREMQTCCSGIPIAIVDFRRTILSTGTVWDGVETEARDSARFIRFTLGSDSLLEPLSGRSGCFRVTMYDPRKMMETHGPGKHQYLLCREAFEADLVLNLPKLKTHRKAGLTGALKNLVGFNGSKDFLPHHRVGGTLWGGDCYPGMAPLKRMAEFFLDHANRNIGSPASQVWTERAQRVLRWHRKVGDPEMEGGWYGNDTVWRMVLDLNRILLYGKPDGTLADIPQRRIWSLTDAVVCGQGEGPLAPTPLLLKAATFSASSPAADAVHAALFRFDPKKIPLLREAFGLFRWPLVHSGDVTACFHGRRLAMDDAAAWPGLPAVPPKGWVGHCEQESRTR